MKTEYARLLSGWVGWPDPNEVIQQVRVAERRPRNAPKAKRATRFDANSNSSGGIATALMVLPDRKDPRLWPQREALKLALQYPHVAGRYFDDLPDDAFSNETYAALNVAIAQAGGCINADGGAAWLAAVSDRVHDLVGKSLVSELAVEPVHIETEDEVENGLLKHIDKTLSRLQEQRVGNQIALLKGKLQRMRPSDDEVAYNSMFADLVALEQSRRELLKRVFE